MPFFNIDTGKHPIVIINFLELSPNDQDIEALLADLHKLLKKQAKQKKQLHFIYNIKAPLVLTLEQRHIIAEWIKRNFELIKNTVLSTAYVTAYGTHEIMIESLYFLQAPDWPVSNYKSLEEAIEWTKKMLAE